MVGIEDDEVGVGARLNRALARKEAEELGGLRRGRLDESVQVDAARRHAVRVEQMHAIFDARNAVGDFGEVAAAHFLLLVEVEGGVIGGDRVDLAAGQRVPEHLLVPRFAQRRRHDVLRPFEVRPLGVRSVEHEIRDHRLDPQRARRARAAARAEASASAHDVWTT